MEKAKAFAAEHGLTAAYDNVEALARDDSVDCIYVATPHTLHYENTRAALENGKPVLCEKPMTMNRREAEELFALAKEKNLFLMEAMWARFQPNSHKAKGWLKSGEIGDLRLMDMQYCFEADLKNPPKRLIQPELGGGSLYDLGVYTVEMASWYADANPADYAGFCVDYMPGSDASAVMAVRYPGDILATMRTSITCDAGVRATLMGTKGRIEVDSFNLAPAARLYHGFELVEESLETDDAVQGFSVQIKAVSQYLREGVKESGLVPARDSIATADVLGTMMKRFYPFLYGGN